MKSFSLMLLAAALAAAATHARADDAIQLPAVTVTGTNAPNPQKEPNQTASRLGLTPEEMPATVEILTQEDLQLRGLRTSREAFADVVGAVSGNVPGNPAVVGLRGFSGNALSVLQDGVRISTSTFVTRDTNTWHYERIEVIKGPSSVLYGEGALAGIINKVTRKPTLDGNRYEGLFGYGSFNTLTTAAGANLKLSDTVALRLDASRLKSDSLYDVDANETQSTGLTGSLLFKPSERFSALVALDHYDDRYDGTYQGVPLVDRSVARDPSNALSSSTNDLVIDRALRRENYNPDGATSGARDTTLRTRLDFAFDEQWSLSSDLVAYTADRDFVYSGTQNFIAPTEAFPNGSFARDVQRVYHDQDTWSARVVALNDRQIAGLRNRFSIGAEYSHTDFHNPRQQSPVGAVEPVDPFSPVVGDFPSGDGVYSSGNSIFDTTVRTRVVFAENALNLTPAWLLVGGVRYEDIELDRSVTDLNADGAVSRASPEYHPFSWRIGTTYELSPQLTLYSQYTTAITPVSSILTISLANTSFRLTSGRAVEAGLRSSLLDERVTATLAAYRIEQDDILTRDPANPTLAVQGGQLLSRGVELSLSARPARQLQLAAGASYNDAEYRNFFEGSAAVDRSGNRPINIPKIVAQASALYRLDVLPLTLGVFARHASDFYTDTANTYRVKGRTTYDASARYALSENLELALRGRNLTDAFYGEYSGYPSTNIYIGAPRSAELSLSMRF